MSCVKLFSTLTNKSLLHNTVVRSTITAFRSQSGKEDCDVVTHTGQQWDTDDYRLARFVDRPKHVNTQFAIDLIAKVPPQQCKDRVVWCDGGDSHTGHPRVYINLDKPGCHICGYCGLRFHKEDSH